MRRIFVSQTFLCTVLCQYCWVVFLFISWKTHNYKLLIPFIYREKNTLIINVRKSKYPWPFFEFICNFFIQNNAIQKNHFFFVNKKSISFCVNQEIQKNNRFLPLNFTCIIEICWENRFPNNIPILFTTLYWHSMSFFNVFQLHTNLNNWFGKYKMLTVRIIAIAQK